MNHLEIKDEILRLLEEIVDRTHHINQNHPHKDLSLEIDMVRGNMRLLYRRFEMLGALSGVQAEEKKEEAVHDQEPEGKDREEQAVNEAMAGKAVSPEPVHPGPESSVAGPGQEDAEPPAAPPPPPPAPKEPKPNNGNKALIDILSVYSNRTIGDQYMKEEDDSLHQRIAGHKEDKSIGARMQQNPVESLKDVIGVNEKFLFINELFNGNIQEYHQAIAKLNEMKDVKDAFDYLNTLGLEYSWDANRSAATIEKLANFVQRRHMNR